VGTHLVKVGLEPVGLCLCLEQAGPELVLGLLLPQDELDVTIGVVDGALLGVDVLVELHDALVGDMLGGGFAGEGELGGLDVQLKVGARDIGGRDGKVDEVAGGIGA
jgi:hypothetical protein